MRAAFRSGIGLASGTALLAGVISACGTVTIERQKPDVKELDNDSDPGFV